MNALELTAFGLLGMVLSVLVAGTGSPLPYMTVAGGMGIPLEDALADVPQTRLAFGGHPHRAEVDPAIAAFPRAF